MQSQCWKGNACQSFQVCKKPPEMHACQSCWVWMTGVSTWGSRVCWAHFWCFREDGAERVSQHGRSILRYVTAHRIWGFRESCEQTFCGVVAGFLAFFTWKVCFEALTSPCTAVFIPLNSRPACCVGLSSLASKTFFIQLGRSIFKILQKTLFRRRIGM